jgi:phospholipid/cholesterol/gamma-HCH transport system permease protein
MPPTTITQQPLPPQSGPIASVLGRFGAPTIGVITHVSGIVRLFGLTLRLLCVDLFRRPGRTLGLVFPLMRNVGQKSLPIVALVSFLVGAILVLQTAAVMKKFGQLELVPGMVALSFTKELGPLMTAIVLTARVGASFTAVLASMRINEEIMALETMAIHPVGYLIGPRFLSMIVMVPCLTVFAYLIGMTGGWAISHSMYDLSTSLYVNKTFEFLKDEHLRNGLIKSAVFSVIISTICCYFGFTTDGGPVGLGRNTMIAVVASLVVIIIADAMITAIVEQ